MNYTIFTFSGMCDFFFRINREMNYNNFKNLNDLILLNQYKYSKQVIHQLSKICNNLYPVEYNNFLLNFTYRQVEFCLDKQADIYFFQEVSLLFINYFESLVVNSNPMIYFGVKIKKKLENGYKTNNYIAIYIKINILYEDNINNFSIIPKNINFTFFNPILLHSQKYPTGLNIYLDNIILITNFIDKNKNLIHLLNPQVPKDEDHKIITPKIIFLE